jgi:hypothetical protein
MAYVLWKARQSLILLVRLVFFIKKAWWINKRFKKQLTLLPFLPTQRPVARRESEEGVQRLVSYVVIRVVRLFSGKYVVKKETPAKY